MRALLRIFLAATVLSASPVMFAQQPTVVHGQVTTEAADHGLSAAIDGLKRQKGLHGSATRSKLLASSLLDGTPAESIIWKAMATPWSKIPMKTTNRPITP